MSNNFRYFRPPYLPPNLTIKCWLLGRWDKQLIDQASDVPSNIFSFIISHKLRALKTLYFYKAQIETIFAKNFARNYMRKDNAWNIIRLVDESFGPATQ